jgi:hypothetical protein
MLQPDIQKPFCYRKKPVVTSFEKKFVFLQNSNNEIRANRNSKSLNFSDLSLGFTGLLLGFLIYCSILFPHNGLLNRSVFYLSFNFYGLSVFNFLKKIEIYLTEN